HLPIIVVEDALSANGPHLNLLKKLNMSFITVVKPKGNAYLFDWVNGFNWQEDRTKWDKSQDEYSFIDKDGNTHKLRFINKVPLNETHEDFKVNFLEYWEVDSKGKILYHNTWITDLTISQKNSYQIAQGGRTRWHIENETFNTLKNQGYNFEHNYGHGYKHLSTVFAMFMMLVFLIDQSKQLCCGLFQAALEKLSFKKSRLWREIRHFFDGYIIPSWEVLYKAIINEGIRKVPVLDSS
ncbi:MAG: transposase, partial [Chlamydiota bacterium]